MRKFVSVLFALVLVTGLSLIPAVPAGAQEPLDVVPFILEDDETNSTATWTIAEQYAGDSSVELVNPDVTVDDNYANVWFYLPGDVTLAEIDLETTSFWCYSDAGDFIPYLMFEIPGEFPDDGVLLRINNDAEPSTGFTADWAEFVASEASSPQWQWEILDAEWNTVDSGWDTWETLEGLYGTRVVDCVVVELSSITVATIPAHTVYVDDITISGTIYPVEPIALVDDDFTSATPGWGVTHFDKIQDAIDAVELGTVIVADGTYNENIVVNKSLTLQAASSPIIDGEGALTNPAIHVQAADVIVQGFVVQNFIATGADQASDIGAILVEGDSAEILDNIVWNITCTGTEGVCPAGLGIDVSANDVEVIGNEVYDISSIGIRVRARFEDPEILKTGILLEGNTVHDTGNSGVLVVGYVTGIEIVGGNEIYDSLEPTPYSLLMVPFSTHAPSDVLIEGNTIYNGYGNICLGGVTNITITGNTIYGAIPHYSDPATIKGKNIYIREWGGFLTTDVTITSNNITGAEGSGVYIKYTGLEGAGAMASTTHIEFNNISGNTEYGVENNIATAVDAYMNWWGDISGPEYTTTNPGGTGDAVSDYVDYLPWLTRDFETVLADNIAYFGFPMVSLETGWNTFSTPVALDPGCDTWAEYVDLGDGLSVHATSPAYAFDGNWVPLIGENADYELKPCDAIYVRMAEPDRAAILWSPDPSVPSKDLYAGWNLVGLAYLELGETSLWANDALETVYEVTGDLTGYSLVVSPPVAGQDPWVFWRDAETSYMYITQGYWVFMINPGTLAGFSFTPIPLPTP